MKHDQRPGVLITYAIWLWLCGAETPGHQTSRRGDMNYTYVAMNKRTGVSLTSTMAGTFAEAYAKAAEIGLDMNTYVIWVATWRFKWAHLQD